jgi:phospholipase/lecithinase/hemolysin
VDSTLPRVDAFNAKLGPRVELLKKSGVQAQIFDAHSWFNNALAHPEELGLKNVTGYACSSVYLF